MEIFSYYYRDPAWIVCARACGAQRGGAIGAGGQWRAFGQTIAITDSDAAGRDRGSQLCEGTAVLPIVSPVPLLSRDRGHGHVPHVFLVGPLISNSLEFDIHAFLFDRQLTVPDREEILEELVLFSQSPRCTADRSSSLS